MTRALSTLIGALERSQAQASIWHLTALLRREFKAQGASVLELLDRDSASPRFRKHWEHHGRHDQSEFRAEGSFAMRALELNRPLLLTSIDATRPNHPIASGYAFTLTESGVEEEPIELAGIVAPGTVEAETSLLYWPIRASESMWLVMKLGRFDNQAPFVLEDVLRMSEADEVLRAFFADWNRVGGFSLILAQQQSSQDFLSVADSLFFYKELASGLFHAVGNNLNQVDSELLVEATTLTSQNAGIDRVELLSRINESRELIAASKQIIKRAQERARYMKPQSQLCDLVSDVIRPAVDFVQRRELARESRIEIEHSFLSDSYPVAIDRGYGEESIINVLHNAIWASKRNIKNGRKRIYVLVRPDTRNDVSIARVEIEDNGCGIAPEHLGRVFEPFFTTRKEGSGLGLYFTQRIFEYFGGSVCVARSVLRKGTTIELTLPLTK